MFSTFSTYNSNIGCNSSINFPQNLSVVSNNTLGNVVISFNPPPMVDISINSYTSVSTAIIGGGL